MCGYFCIGFIGFMFNGNSLTEITNLFSSNDFKKNDDVISNYFLNKLLKWLIQLSAMNATLMRHQI